MFKYFISAYYRFRSVKNAKITDIHVRDMLNENRGSYTNALLDLDINFKQASIEAIDEVIEQMESQLKQSILLEKLGYTEEKMEEIKDDINSTIELKIININQLN